MVSVEISRNNPFFASLKSGKETRNFGIINHTELDRAPETAKSLLQTLIVAHLIAPDLPDTITTNFALAQTEIVNMLYKFYGQSPPRIIASDNGVQLKFDTLPQSRNDINYANAHSGGLDSVYRVAEMVRKGESVMAVHLRNLNPKACFQEAKASELQTASLKIPYRELHLVNSSGNFGFGTMRTRDLVLAMATAMVGFGYGARNVLIEGDFVKDPEKAEFSEYQKTWERFNDILKGMNLGIKIIGMDAGDIETVGKVIEIEKELGIPILPLVQNCFSAGFQKNTIRKKWARETPNIEKASSEHWCGSCLKCRRMTLGRLYYHDPSLSDVPEKEVEYFINDTRVWMKKYTHNRDLISESFNKHLNDLFSTRK